MSEQEDVCEFLAEVEATYLERVVKSWIRDPESFWENIRILEDVIDLRKKVCT